MLDHMPVLLSRYGGLRPADLWELTSRELDRLLNYATG